MRTLTFDEIDDIFAGFSWRQLAASVGGGAAAGALTGAYAGAVGGSFAFPIWGTVVGAGGGAAFGAITGAIAAGVGYTATDLINSLGC